MSGQNTIRKLVGAGLAVVVAGAGFAGSASAQSYDAGLGSIVGCSAPGGEQTTGALLGAVLGAVAGNSMSKGDRGGGTALGAVIGGGAGSWLGCKMQRDRLQARQEAYYGYGYAYADDDAPRYRVRHRSYHRPAPRYADYGDDAYARPYGDGYGR